MLLGKMAGKATSWVCVTFNLLNVMKQKLAGRLEDCQTRRITQSILDGIEGIDMSLIVSGREI